jgi:hypothetical protein
MAEAGIHLRSCSRSSLPSPSLHPMLAAVPSSIRETRNGPQVLTVAPKFKNDESGGHRDGTFRGIQCNWSKIPFYTQDQFHYSRTRY